MNRTFWAFATALAVCGSGMLCGCPSPTGPAGIGWAYPVEEWARGEIIQQMPDGQFFVIGRAEPLDPPSNDDEMMFVASISADGRMQAYKLFRDLYSSTGLPGRCAGFMDNSGKITLAGLDGTEGFPTSHTYLPGYLRVVQADASLNTTLDSTYGKFIQWRVESVMPAEDGAVLMSGTEIIMTAISTFILELNQDGEITILGEYGDWETDRTSMLSNVRDSAAAINGDIVLAGSIISTDYERNDRNMGLQRVRRDGTPVWLRNYEMPKRQDGYALACLPDGSFLLAGKSGNPSIPYLIKSDAAGNEVWARDDVLGFDPGKLGYDIWDMAVDTDGSILLVGQGRTIDYPGGIGFFPIETRASFLIKLDASGDNIWTRNLGLAYIYGVCTTNRGTYMTVGVDSRGVLVNLIEVDRSGSIVN